jgi:hypothetical protein
MMGESAGGETAIVLLACVGLIAVFAPLTMRMYARHR